MKNKKIHFQKLVNQHCPYSYSERLQILEWMFKSGKGYNIQTGRWNVDGIDKLIYDYSANTSKSYTKIESWKHVRLMFINAIVPETYVQKWRDDLGIKLGATKFLSFQLGDYEYLNFGSDRRKDIFDILKSLEGKKLNKEFFHPDYPDRTNPFIQSIKFTISEAGCHIFLTFTFDECKGSSWREEFWKRDESMEDFFLNSFKTIDSWLLSPQIFSSSDAS